MAGDDLGYFHQALFERQRHVLGVRVHHDADERGHAKPQRLGREDGLVAGDVAVVLQQLDPPPARRGGQRYLVGKFGNGEAGVVLQGSEQGAVGAVEA
ncbi:hypothetical protein D3C75_959800 [compost metagenome]